MKFNEKLQKLRKGRKMSQEDLADLLDVSRQSVSKWESGQTYPEMDKLIALSKIFKCSLDDLTNDNISEIDINVKKKNNVSNFVYELLEMISKSFEMFKHMSFKETSKCILELGILVICLLCFRIPLYYIINLGHRIFINFGNTGYHICSSIWDFIINMIYLILFIVIFVFIYKTRYLDKYDFSKLTNDNSNDNKNDTEPIEEIKYNNVNSNSKDTYPVVFNLLGSITILFVKFITVCITCPFLISLFGLFVAFIIGLILLFKGVFYIGIILGIIFAIILNIWLLEIIFDFIFNRKIGSNRIFITLIIGIAGLGCSLGITAIEFANTKFIDNVPSTIEAVKDIKTITMRDDLMLGYHYYPNAKYVIDETLNDIIKIEYSYYDDYSSINYFDQIDNNNEVIGVYTTDKSSAIKKIYQLVINDLAHKRIHNYSKLFDVNITIYGTSDNLDKIKQNIVEYNNKLNEEEYNNELENYQNSIYELENQINDLNSENENLKDQLEMAKEELVEYKENIKTIIDN